MPFLSITAKGMFFQRQIISTYWYVVDPPGSAWSAASLAEAMDAWQTTVRAPLLAWHDTEYTLQQQIGQGYDSLWARTPYLPLIRDVNLVGSAVQDAAPPIVAAILSCRVNPVVPGRRKRADGTIYTSPVRRGYFAFGPVNRAETSQDGFLAQSAIASARYVNLAAAVRAELSPAGWATRCVPIRVSPPLENEDARGYGTIDGSVWRAELSTRRSRKTGIGA